MSKWVGAVLLLALAAGASARPSDVFVETDSSAQGKPKRSLLLRGGIDVTAANRFSYYVSIRSFYPTASYQLMGTSWPDMINQASTPHACGGTLLKPTGQGLYQFVLTTASCVSMMSNPVVIIGALTSDTGISPKTKPCWTQGPCSNAPGLPFPRWPQIRTTYASYTHESWNGVAGSDFDVAVLILDAQALPTSTGTCPSCITPIGAKPADNAALSVLGMGTQYKQQNTPASRLQEAAVKSISNSQCSIDVRPVGANQMCTVGGSSNESAGPCRLDEGGPLVQKGATRDDDRLVGIAAPPTQSCNSKLDPSVYADVTKVMPWVNRVINTATPAVDAKGFPVAPAVREPSVRVVFGYSMKVKYVNRNTGQPVSCTNDRRGLSIGFMAGPNAAFWSRVFLEKGFYDPLSKKSFKKINDMSNPFAVNIISCKDGEVKYEWSSSKGFADTKAMLDSKLVPANSADWSTGSRYWARAMRCDANTGPVDVSPIVIKSFEITTGKGANKKWLAGTTAGTSAVYDVDINGYPTDCEGKLDLEDGSVPATPSEGFVDPNDEKGCVSTPREFREAFEKREARCVSPDLFSRITSSYSGDGGTLQEALSGPTNNRMAAFIGGSEVLAKYLRIGYPQFFGFSSPDNIVGLFNQSNGLAFLTQVGYSAAYANAWRVYVLNVVHRSALEAGTRALLDKGYGYRVGIPPVQVTWDAVRDYFQFVFADTTPKFALSDAALKILKETDFGTLTDCPPECAYINRDFPAVSQTPITTLDRTNPTTCPPAPTGKVATTSTARKEDSALCNQEWKDALAAVRPLLPTPVFACSKDSNLAMGRGIAKLLADRASNPRRQAMLFRAFLTTGCAGSFNSLFSGDGITYTGFGGTMSPLGQEFIVSPFELNQAQLDDPDLVVRIPLCLGGNSGKPTGTTPENTRCAKPPFRRP